LLAGVAHGRPFSTLPGRTLLAAFTVSDICQKPQEVAITIANSLVEGTGLTVAESEVRNLYYFTCNTCFSLLPNQLPSASLMFFFNCTLFYFARRPLLKLGQNAVLDCKLLLPVPLHTLNLQEQGTNLPLLLQTLQQLLGLKAAPNDHL
jgi:hypothetical protein